MVLHLSKLDAKKMVENSIINTRVAFLVFAAILVHSYYNHTGPYLYTRMCVRERVRNISFLFLSSNRTQYFFDISSRKIMAITKKYA